MINVRVVPHRAFTEVFSDGSLTSAEIDAAPVPFLAAEATRPVLLNCATVGRVDAPVTLIQRLLRVATERHSKVAVFATNPLLFGVAREAILSSGLGEGWAIAVFRERDEAVAWLESDGRPAWHYGGSGPR